MVLLSFAAQFDWFSWLRVLCVWPPGKLHSFWRLGALCGLQERAGRGEALIPLLRRVFPSQTRLQAARRATAAGASTSAPAAAAAAASVSAANAANGASSLLRMHGATAAAAAATAAPAAAGGGGGAGILGIARGIVQTDGVAGFWRGTGPSVIRRRGPGYYALSQRTSACVLGLRPVVALAFPSMNFFNQLIS